MAKILLKFSGKEKKMYGARWNAQMKGLVEFKKCQNVRQEVKLSDRPEILKGMIEDKIRLQSSATDKITNRFLRRYEGTGRKEIERGLAACPEKAHFVEISEM